MKLIVISESKYFAGEEDVIHKLFEAGLEILHVRKPKQSTEEMKAFLEKIHSKYYSRIVIHSHHELASKFGLRGIHISDKHRKERLLDTWFRTKILKLKIPELLVSASFHDIGTLLKSKAKYNYVFLSPIFDSISKLGYKNRFNEKSLLSAIEKSQYGIIAMGGIDEQHIQKVKDMGFSGCAVFGAIWMSEDPVGKFKAIQKICKEVSLVS